MTDENNMQDEVCWVFRAFIADCAGALTSIASAFSNEGISIVSIAAHGTDEHGGKEAALVLTFCSTEADKDKMVRKLKRLGKVKKLEEQESPPRGLLQKTSDLTTNWRAAEFST